MKFNVEKIKKLYAESNRSLNILKTLAQLERGQIVESDVNLDRVKYNFIVVIQSLIDICNHIVAKSHGRVPEDYGDCFKSLSELGVIDSNLATRLSKLSGFRNLLIHLYWQVDNSKVYDILKNNLGDIDDFLGKISDYLKGELTGP